MHAILRSTRALKQTHRVGPGGGVGGRTRRSQGCLPALAAFSCRGRASGGARGVAGAVGNLKPVPNRLAVECAATSAPAGAGGTAVGCKGRTRGVDGRRGHARGISALSLPPSTLFSPRRGAARPRPQALCPVPACPSRPARTRGRRGRAHGHWAQFGGQTRTNSEWPPRLRRRLQCMAWPQGTWTVAPPH